VSPPAAEANSRFCRLVWRYAVTGGVPRRSLWVALVVGSILNLINQGDRLIAGQALDFDKLALTYLVPYFVSTYGAVSFRFNAGRVHARRSNQRAEEQNGHSRSGEALRGDL
jgi:hypothetical protein